MRWPPPPDWPNVAHSRQVYSRPHRWHVQEMGAGDTVLLLHGAGGSTHSFRNVMPLLAEHFHVIALDLPGQGFTQLGARHRSGLMDTADDIAALCAQEGWHPVAIVGHSAGGALALRLSNMMLSPRGQIPRVIGINPALDHFQGVAGVLFPVLAKMLAAVPFTARLFANSARNMNRVEALITGTGSDLDMMGMAYYQRLTSDRDHADATLLMMSQWELEDLLRDLSGVPAGTLFLAGGNDKAVPSSVSDKAARKMPDAQVIHLPHLGHLAHEEAPDEIARHILDFLQCD